VLRRISCIRKRNQMINTIQIWKKHPDSRQKRRRIMLAGKSKSNWWETGAGK